MLAMTVKWPLDTVLDSLYIDEPCVRYGNIQSVTGLVNKGQVSKETTPTSDFCVSTRSKLKLTIPTGAKSVVDNAALATNGPCP